METEVWVEKVVVETITFLRYKDGTICDEKRGFGYGSIKDHR